MKKRPPLIWIAFLATLGSGLIDIRSVAAPSLPARFSLVREIFQLEFLHLSRFLTLIIGFALRGRWSPWPCSLMCSVISAPA